VRALIAALLSVGLALPVRAETTNAPAAPIKGKVAIAPIGTLEGGGLPVGPIELLLHAEAQRQPEVVVVSAADVRAGLRRLKKRELEDCDGRVECLVELGRALGAGWVIAGEATPLPEGQVVYLKLVEIDGGREVGSTTAVLDPKNPTARAEARAAMIRLLRPSAYLGALALKLDVGGATVYIDGKRVATVASIPVPVGTHALRVTHPQYRDFVRFVDVGFDQRVAIDVDLKRYPVVADSMRQDRGDVKPVEPLRTGKVLPRPWYREWWAIAGFGALVLASTAAITYYADPGVTSDREVVVEP
jgi:hypothetical protein